MKKILSKVLVAVSIFNGVNISACAMEEKPANLQTGVSNSWKEWAQNERKRINGLVDWMIQNELNNRCHFRVDLGESNEESDTIDKQVADTCRVTDPENYAIIPQFSRLWNPISDYDKKYEELSLPYILYSRGVCRNRTAWVVRSFLRNSIFARVVELLPKMNGTRVERDGHAVVLYAIPDENCENKWNYYIADMMRLTNVFNEMLNRWKEVASLLPKDFKEICRNEYMQIPLKQYLKSERVGGRDIFIIEFFYREPSLNFLDSVKEQIQDIIYSEFSKVCYDEKISVYLKEAEINKYRERKDSLEKMWEKYYNDYLYSKHSPNSCLNGYLEGKISKEEASKRGVTDLTMWCQRNCPDVLK